jgi:hypothetical protein
LAKKICKMNWCDEFSEVEMQKRQILPPIQAIASAGTHPDPVKAWSKLGQAWSNPVKASQT